MMSERSLHILLVEDDEDDYVLTCDLLSEARGEGYDLTWVTTCPDAVTALETGEYDVALIDYRLGAWSGLDVVKEAHARAIKTPLVVLTGQGDREVDLQAMEAGAADYLVKGQMDAQLLERTIRYAVERAATLRDLHYRAQFEMLIATISTRFINLAPHEIDSAITEALGQLGEFAEVSASYVFLLEEQNTLLRNTHAWSERGNGAPSTSWKEIKINAIPWVLEQFRAFKAVVIPRLKELPPHANAERAILEEQGIQSIVAVPMILRNSLVGFVAFTTDSEQQWSLDTVDLLRMVGEIFANALARQRAEEAIQRQVQRLNALRTIDLAITTNTELVDTLEIILEQTITQLGIDAAAVLLLHQESLTLNYSVVRGFHLSHLRPTPVHLGEGYAGQAALRRQLIKVPNLPEAQHGSTQNLLPLQEAFESYHSVPLVAYYGVPLVAKGEVQGVLELFHHTTLAPDAAWRGYLEALAGQAAIAIDNATLFKELQSSNFELVQAYETTLEGWSHALDLRDNETQGHTQRVTDVAVQLAREAGMSEAELVYVRRGALLHDIGKMGIPDTILLKPGPLSDEEWKIMKQHPIYAYELLSPIEFLRPALDIPYAHHEKWDGTGYPRGLKGEAIPFAARIFAIVDVWDALTSDRPYRAAWSEERAMAYIQEQAGSHFDAHVVEVFLRILERNGRVSKVLSY